MSVAEFDVMLHDLRIEDARTREAETLRIRSLAALPAEEVTLTLTVARSTSKPWWRTFVA